MNNNLAKLKDFFKSHENLFVAYHTEEVLDNFKLVFSKKTDNLVCLPQTEQPLEILFKEKNGSVVVCDMGTVYKQHSNIFKRANKNLMTYFKNNNLSFEEFEIYKSINYDNFVLEAIQFIKNIFTLYNLKPYTPYVLENEHSLEVKEDLIKTWVWEKKFLQKTEGEVVDLYDLDRQKLQQKEIRGNQLPQFTHRLTVHIVIFNSQNQMLIQKRAKTKKVFPGIWDVSVAGGVLENEKSCEAMRREVEEELGITFDFGYFRPSLTINFRGGFDDYYLINNFDVDLSELTTQKEEIEELKWADEKEVLELIQNKQFTPYDSSFIASLFHLKNIRGALIEY